MTTKTIKTTSTSKLVNRLIYGSLSTDTYYDFVDATDIENVLVELDSTAPVGPVSGKSNWVIRVHPGERAQEIAEAIWEELDWSDVPDNSVDPTSQNCNETGWYCVWIVKIQY